VIAWKPSGSTAWIRRPVPGDDVDLVELALAVEQALCRLEIEGRHRRAADRRPRGQLDHARQAVRIDAHRGHDPDLVADLQARLLDRVGVDHDLVALVRSLAGELERADVRVPRRADRRRATPRDHLVRPRIDHLREAAHAPVRGGHVRDRLDVRQDLLGDRVALLRAAPAAPRPDVVERVLGLHDHVGPREDVAEEIVERGEGGVGEHERAGDEPDAQDDRDRREEQSQLPGEEALERGAPHRQASSDFIRSRTRSVVGSRISSTTCPSARNTIRSA
jgi:hypothetical protein